MAEENNVMEFMGESGESVRLGNDLTVMESGDHSIPMDFGKGMVNVPTNITRGLSVIQVSYTHNNHIYTSVIHSDGKHYTNVEFLGSEEAPPRNWQEKGMWRYY